MLFDKLAGIVEKEYTNYKFILEGANIFQFDKEYKDNLSLTIDINNGQEFFLPFKTTAVENNSSCVIMYDPIENQVGFEYPRYFIGCYNATNAAEVLKEQQMAVSEIGNILVVFAGNFVGKAFQDDRGGLDAKLNFIKLYSKKGLVANSYKTTDMLKRMGWYKLIVNTPLMTLQQLISLNTPDKFVLETTLTRPKKQWWKKKKPKIRRSGERSLYTILEPNKIREVLNPEVRNTHMSPVIHQRRRHKRWLRDEKYRFDSAGKFIEPQFCPKGKLYYKTVIVPAMWVGASEAIIGNKRYKVRLDL